MTLRDAVAVVERRLILAALDRAGGSTPRPRGAPSPETQLYAKLEEHGLASTAPAPQSSKRSS